MAVIKKNGFNYFDDIGGQPSIFIIESDRLSECISFIKENNIKRIAISRSQGFYLENVDFLHECNFVEHLVIMDCEKLNNLNAIHSLQNLKYLSINGNRQNIDFSNFQLLNTLKVDWSNKLKNLDSCTQLRYLQLYYYKPKSKSIEEISNLTTLEQLALVQSPITTLDGIEKLQNLKEIELSYLSKLEKIAPVASLNKTLEVLKFDHCKRIKDHESVGALNNLKILAFNHCSEIESLGFVRKMSSLQDIRFVGTNIKDGDLSPCENFKYVGFFDKKHYSHKFEELNPDKS